MLINDIKVKFKFKSLDLAFNKTRTKAVYRVGPHNFDVLSVLICGMLGD
jgi:hypothetical protein